MKTAIIYYSMSGNTQQTAEKISAELGADLIRIDPKDNPSAENDTKIKAFCEKL